MRPHTVMALRAGVAFSCIDGSNVRSERHTHRLDHVWLCACRLVQPGAGQTRAQRTSVEALDDTGRRGSVAPLPGLPQSYVSRNSALFAARRRTHVDFHRSHDIPRLVAVSAVEYAPDDVSGNFVVLALLGSSSSALRAGSDPPANASRGTCASCIRHLGCALLVTLRLRRKAMCAAAATINRLGR